MKSWNYASAETHQVSDMICTACRKPIDNGEFRYRETDAGYFPQHRACSSDDVNWSRSDAKRAAQIAFYADMDAAFKKFCETYGPPDDEMIDAARASQEQP